MSIAFIHLSDIHFGQEKGGTLVIHNDAKDRLVEDVARAVKRLPEGIASGIIISGDIAYAGKHDEYAEAGQWLDQVANAAGCAITDIQVVPGNHDIDRDRISGATAWMLQEIADSFRDVILKGSPRPKRAACLRNPLPRVSYPSCHARRDFDIEPLQDLCVGVLRAQER